MTASGVHRLALRSFLVCLAILPFELPVAEGVYGVFRPIVGASYPLLFVGSLLIFASIPTVLTMRVPRARLLDEATQSYLLLALVFVLIGFYATVVTVLHGGFLANSFRQLVLGHLTPAIVCLVILLLDPREQRRAWLWFYGGYVVCLLISFAFFVASYRAAVVQYPSFFQLGIGQRLFLWRFTFAEPWNTYAIYIGNANKTSNNILIFLLLSVRLLGPTEIAESRWTRRALLAFWFLGTVTLLVLFSRAVLLLFPVVVWASGIMQIISRRTKVAMGLVFAGSLLLAFNAYYDALAYLLLSQGIGASSGFLGTFDVRLQDAQLVSNLISTRADVLLGGLGTSGFSMLFFGDEVMGTHNTFLDTLVESGVVGLALLIGVMVMMTIRTMDWRRLRLRQPFGLVAIAVLTLLMTREHSFSYLYTTSLGGFCFTALFFVLVLPGRGVVRSPKLRLAAAGGRRATGGMSRFA